LLVKLAELYAQNNEPALARRLAEEALARTGYLQGGPASGESTASPETAAEARVVVDSKVVAESLWVLAILAYSGGEYDRMGRLLDEALPFAQAAGGKTLLRALAESFRYVWARGDLKRGQGLAAELLAQAQDSNQPLFRYTAYKNLALTAVMLGDAQTGLQYFEASLEEARALRHRVWEAQSLGNLAAWHHNNQGDLELAKRMYRQSREIYRSLGMDHAAIFDLSNLADLHLDMGDLATTRVDILEALQIARHSAEPPKMLVCLAVYARLLAAQGNRVAAFRLFDFVRRHPAAQSQTHDYCDEELERLGMTPSEMDAGLAGAIVLDLETVVDEIVRGVWGSI
jgi:tetratricopeptide (TPR) repeat protein